MRLVGASGSWLSQHYLVLIGENLGHHFWFFLRNFLSRIGVGRQGAARCAVPIPDRDCIAGNAWNPNATPRRSRTAAIPIQHRDEVLTGTDFRVA
jgi:hypothetical protein